MTASGRLSGKVAIVTGAASGIGATAALRFAAEGAQVACVDSNVDGAGATAARIGAAAIAVGADLSKPDDAERMTEETLRAFGSPTVVYANAGIAGAGNAAEVSYEDWQRVIDVNLTGVWLSSKYVLPHMIEAGGGSIVNQASVGGIIGVPGIASYAAAKAGVIGLTRQMAVDYGPQNIRVNAICPGTVPTPLVEATYAVRGGFATGRDEDTFESLLEAARARFPIGRLGTVEEIAALALYLASDEAAWTTGTAIPIDGGMSAQ